LSSELEEQTTKVAMLEARECQSGDGEGSTEKVLRSRNNWAKPHLLKGCDDLGLLSPSDGAAYVDDMLSNEVCNMT
jgi:hypothetical protein